ncbi:putative DNA-binding domain-containing protein [Methylomicrobium sp. Wu6]|uniref:HvfC family RiPP maturation protein n=1 Tax=Methylomicrobium sp. Wu6 TaxID=3107928 RepID=UPI002DD6609F|nr:putative DNA-binding domain-containing protein [Methylomicrobium sp. Wu6]MEC4748830.1 putative DNA-binding domain-containing protein [Methylomicrobium sp. Wu6]
MGVDFKAKQQEFSAYLRDPAKHPAPADVKPGRMAIYRELFFNNIDNFLAVNFPVLRKLLTDTQWRELAEDFFTRHTCKTPYFTEIAEEFLDYLQTERNHPDDPPYMLELAHYEWAEMAVSIAKEDNPVNPPFSGDWSTQALHLSPQAWPLAYRFPVHLISPDYQPSEPPEQPTFLIVYRNLDDEVRFIHITPITYQLLALIQERPGQTAAACLKSVAEQLRHPQPEIIYEGGLKIVRDLAAKNIILFDAKR